MHRLVGLVCLAVTAMAQNAPAPSAQGDHVLSTGVQINAVSAPAPHAAGNLAGVPDLLPKLQGKPTLIGGEISGLDSVRDEITIHVFGSRSLRVLFDTRTQIYRDGTPASVAGLRPGAHVYVDTVLAGKSIFARTIRIVTSHSGGQTVGQITGYDLEKGRLLINDPLSPREFALHLSPTTVIERSGSSATPAELKDGSLVSVEFVAADKGGDPLARRVSILAEPGSSFVFSGQVTFLDLRQGMLAILDTRTHKSYDIAFDPKIIDVNHGLTEGSSAEITTTFDGHHYVASAIRLSARQDEP